MHAEGPSDNAASDRFAPSALAESSREGTPDCRPRRARRGDLAAMRLFALLLALALALSGVAYWLVVSGRWIVAHPSLDNYPVQGVDVSRHQGAIDWPALAAEGIEFAYIKATEGGDWIDPEFAANWSGADHAGIARGAYHFFTFCRDPEEQAAHALAVAPPEPGTLPMAVDVEYSGNCSDYGTVDEVRQRLDRFMEIVTDSLGRPPVIYAVFEAYPDFVEDRYLESPVWVQNIWWEPSPPDRDWTFWQYTVTGRLSGVDAPIDINVFRGSREAFNTFVAGPDTLVAPEPDR